MKDRKENKIPKIATNGFYIILSPLNLKNKLVETTIKTHIEAV